MLGLALFRIVHLSAEVSGDSFTNFSDVRNWMISTHGTCAFAPAPIQHFFGSFIEDHHDTLSSKSRPRRGRVRLKVAITTTADCTVGAYTTVNIHEPPPIPPLPLPPALLFAPAPRAPARAFGHGSSRCHCRSKTAISSCLARHG